MEIIYNTDLSYYDEDAECKVDKCISLVKSCGMYAIIIAENDENYENVERFEIIRHSYSFDEAMMEYKNYGGEI